MIPLVCGRFCLQPVKVGTEYHICLQPQNALKFTKAGQLFHLKDRSPQRENDQKRDFFVCFFVLTPSQLKRESCFCPRCMTDHSGITLLQIITIKIIKTVINVQLLISVLYP